MPFVAYYHIKIRLFIKHIRQFVKKVKSPVISWLADDWPPNGGLKPKLSYNYLKVLAPLQGDWGVGWLEGHGSRINSSGFFSVLPRLITFTPILQSRHLLFLQ